MAYIKVRYSQFDKTIKKIESHIDLMKNKMNEMQKQVEALNMYYEGADYTVYYLQFKSLKEDVSVHSRMIKELEAYVNYLRDIRDKYKTTQEMVNNREASLPK